MGYSQMHTILYNHFDYFAFFFEKYIKAATLVLLFLKLVSKVCNHFAGEERAEYCTCIMLSMYCFSSLWCHGFVSGP